MINIEKVRPEFKSFFEKLETAKKKYPLIRFSYENSRIQCTSNTVTVKWVEQRRGIVWCVFTELDTIETANDKLTKAIELNTEAEAHNSWLSSTPSLTAALDLALSNHYE